MTAFTSRGVCACVCPRTGTERAQSGLEERPTERPAVLNYLICMVPGEGVEPSRACAQRFLRPSRLPVPPSRPGEGRTTWNRPAAGPRSLRPAPGLNAQPPAHPMVVMEVAGDEGALE